MPGDAARSGRFDTLLSQRGLKTLCIVDSEEDCDAHVSARDKAHPQVSIGAHLEFLECLVDFLPRIKNCLSHVSLRDVALQGFGEWKNLKALKIFPFVQNLDLTESQDWPRGRTCELPIDRALTRFALVQFLRELTIRAESLAEGIGTRQLPPALERLDLSFCHIGPNIATLGVGDRLTHLELTCTDSSSAFFAVPWPQTLLQVTLDVDDLDDDGVCATEIL